MTVFAEKTNTSSVERKIYLVRHGQASLGAADYDNLSALGQQQAKRLGAYFASRAIRFDAVYAGTLRRHAQTLAAINAGADWQHQATVRPALDEYDSSALIRAITSAAQISDLPSPQRPDGYKQHFALLRRGIAAWMRSEVSPEGMTSYTTFAQGILGVLDEIRHSSAQSILVSSSGGPLSSAIAQVLGLDHVSGIELNMRMRNTAVSELLVTPKRCILLSFNALPHLDDEAGRAMQTYA